MIDARRSNAWFVDPPAVELATGSALAEIATDDGSEWYVASLDIANAFYSLALPPDCANISACPALLRGRSAFLKWQGSQLPALLGFTLSWPWSLWDGHTR